MPHDGSLIFMGIIWEAKCLWKPWAAINSANACLLIQYGAVSAFMLSLSCYRCNSLCELRLQMCTEKVCVNCVHRTKHIVCLQPRKSFIHKTMWHYNGNYSWRLKMHRHILQSINQASGDIIVRVPRCLLPSLLLCL